VGDVVYAGNPRLLIPAAWHEFVLLWATCRGGMGGIAHWPDSGGVGDQAAWIVDAFGALGSMDAEMQRDEDRRRGR
jgi:hypothetical protein